MSNYAAEDYNLAAFWEEHGELFAEHTNLVELGDVDNDGNPYDWEGDLTSQTPSYDDFISLFAQALLVSLVDGNNDLDLGREEKRSWNNRTIDNMWKLHDELYEEELMFGELSNVQILGKVKFRRAA